MISQVLKIERNKAKIKAKETGVVLKRDSDSIEKEQALILKKSRLDNR